ncbi:MAG: cellobiose phosphorylase [Candidatus Omnitrophota bacterium]|jgi:cellobiose phosphorylase
MVYKFIDNFGTFRIDDPYGYNLYFPLTNKDGSLLSSISPNLAGDIKKDNEHFLTVPAGIEDLRSSLLCRREFFIRTGRQTLRLSFPGKHDVVEAGFLYHKVIKSAPGLGIEIVNFIPFDAAVEVMWVKVCNKSRAAVTLSPTSFIPLFGRSEKNLRDHRHVSSLLNRVYLDQFGIRLRPTMVFDERGHRINTDEYFVYGFEGSGKPPEGQFPTLDYFYGRGDILSPDAVEREVVPARQKRTVFDGKEACAAFRFADKRLLPGEETGYFLVMGVEDSPEKAGKAFQRFNTDSKIRKSLEDTKVYWRRYLSTLAFDFNDAVFNNWLLWVTFQPTLRKLFGCSFLPHFDYGKGGRGWRDLWQDALTLLVTESETAGGLIVSNFKGVRIDGSNATIITKDGDFIADRNRISRVWMDHGVWPYLTLREYVHRTGDIRILLEETSYFRDHQLKRARAVDISFVQKDYLLRSSKGEVLRGTILEHVLVQMLAQFFNVGRHNVIRLENADWNDGLDMAPSRGESAAFSFMYAYNLRDLCVLLTKLREITAAVTVPEELGLLLDRLQSPVDYNDFREKQKRLGLYFEAVKNMSGDRRKISLEDLIRDLQEKASHMSAWLREKQWLKEGFFNGYYDDDSLPVEGRIRGDIRMTLPSQVFAIMSGVATDEQTKSIWRSVNKYLKDKRLGCFHLNTDFGSVYMKLGRAYGFSYGDKENGAFFSHMVVMFANALYKRGFVTEGFEVINSLFKMAVGPQAYINPVLPEYFNAEGKGLYAYLTGSASWFVHTLLGEVLGIKFRFGDLVLEPKLLPANFFAQDIRVSLRSAGGTMRFVFTRDKNISRIIGRGTACRAPTVTKVLLGDLPVPVVRGEYLIKRAALLRAGKEGRVIQVNID